MFDKSIVSSAAEGLDLLERIIDIIMKIFRSLLGGSDDEAAEDATSTAE